MNREERDAAVLARIAQSPCRMADLIDAIGDNHNLIQASLIRLLKQSAISKEQFQGNANRYYIGGTAPKPQEKARHPLTFTMPVKRVVVRPFSIAGEDGKTFSVTLPAAPWEVAA